MVAGRVVPSASTIETSPSSASASSAVTTRPGFQTKPDARARCECTEMIAGAVFATMPDRADEKEDRMAWSVMGNSNRVDPNLGTPDGFRNWPNGQGGVETPGYTGWLCGLNRRPFSVTSTTAS